MDLFAWLFLKVIFRPFIPDGVATEYVAGAVLLVAAPCTAMVFMWSYLSDGDPGYTVVQVTVNDLVILLSFAPIVAFLLCVYEISGSLAESEYRVSRRLDVLKKAGIVRSRKPYGRCSPRCFSVRPAST